MKFVTYRTSEEMRAGVIRDDQVVDLGPEPLQDWLCQPESIEAAMVTGARHALAEVTLCQPIVRPGKILAIGLNYYDHATETGRTPPETQLWFNKQATAANGPYAPVNMPVVSDKLDYEGELVVIIGKYGRHVPEERAMEIVAGFACGCDYSVRDWQRASPTMIMGKGFDTHAPFGPWIVTPDELGRLEPLHVRCFVNGEKGQDGCLADMMFDIRQQIAHLTAAFTLEPGDVIYTGTPSGVGVASTPPRFLKVGDRVRVEIDGIGAIENEIVMESGDSSVSQTAEG